MSPRYHVRYKKSFDNIFVPSQETLLGIVLASRVSMVDNPKEYSSFESLEEAYMKADIRVSEQVNLNGKLTTFGKEKLNTIMKVDIDIVLGNDGGKDYKCINASNIQQVVKTFDEDPQRVEMLKELQDFGLMVATFSGTTLPSVMDMYKGISSSRVEEMQAVESDPNISKEQKVVRIMSIYKEYMRESTEAISDEMNGRIELSTKMKAGSLLRMTTKQAYISTTGEINLTNSSLIESMSQNDYENAAIDARSTQGIKVNAVPQAGYFARQCNLAGSSVVYTEVPNPQSKGILIPMNRAKGRTRIDGSIVPKSDSKDLVEVQSVVTDMVLPLKLAKNMVDHKSYSLDTEGFAVGMSFMSSFSEKLTQGGLSLKHKAGMMFLYDDNQLLALEDGIVTFDSDFIYMSGKKIYKPSTFVDNYKADGFYKKGEIIGYAYKLINPAYLLSCMISFVKAADTQKSKEQEKNDVLKVYLPYALEKGVVKYTGFDDKNFFLKINERGYTLPKNCMIYVADGQEVEYGQRICSGLFNIDAFLKKEKGVKLSVVYSLFRQQILELTSINEEILELLFRIITVLTPNKLDDFDIKYVGVRNSVFLNDDLLVALSFENIKKVIKDFHKKGSIESASSALTNIGMSFNMDMLDISTQMKLGIGSGL